MHGSVAQRIKKAVGNRLPSIELKQLVSQFLMLETNLKEYGFQIKSYSLSAWYMQEQA
jgi:hypothetical protein